MPSAVHLLNSPSRKPETIPRPETLYNDAVFYAHATHVGLVLDFRGNLQNNEAGP